uniref:Uncharacterized protein n=1 Tax=Glossina austeni TaxID=7395 RepID=A0A1A9VHR5_GLOAU
MYERQRHWKSGCLTGQQFNTSADIKPNQRYNKFQEGDIIAQCQKAEYVVNHQVEIPKPCSKISPEAEIFIQRWTSNLEEQQKRYAKKFLLENRSIFAGATSSGGAVICRTIVESNGNFSKEDIRSAQMADKDLNAILKAMEKEERPTWEEISRESPITKMYWQSLIVEALRLWRM